ncbi:hypothetical protein HV192_16105 [Klebsiella oxytoca]|nr:hypothetical protein [Klebsiella grimontii]QLU25297.1 hypothetical protein HV192_16105 [Klebsiella oxytoca]WDI68098.1 hypothetical protein PU992_17160 [Klebsiella grimontii]
MRFHVMCLLLPTSGEVDPGYSPTTRIRLIWVSPTKKRVFTVIAELSAAMAAIKETAGLVKVINDAKTDAEVKAATIDLQGKLITLQAECFSLGDAIRLRDEEVMRLKDKISEFENFEKQTADFVLKKFDTGALVYSVKKIIDGEETNIYYCSQCFNQRVISILQPSSATFFHAGREEHFSQIQCQRCNAVYGKDKMHYRDL